MINEQAVKALAFKNPIGKWLEFGSKKRRIIGVVKDFHFESLHSQIGPVLLTLYPQQLRCLAIRVKQDNIENTLQYIKATISKIEPGYVLEYKFLNETLAALYSDGQRRNKLFTTFSFIAILLSCLGLLGLISHTVEQSTKEIGVRKVLGASVTSIVNLLSRNYIMMVLYANIIAWPVAYYIMDKWLQNFAYRIDISLWMFILAGGIALMIALLTVSWQAVRAALANPVESLRYE